MAIQMAELNVSTLVNKTDRVLLSVGGNGSIRPISIADLISLCVRRERLRN